MGKTNHATNQKQQAKKKNSNKATSTIKTLNMTTKKKVFNQEAIRQIWRKLENETSGDNQEHSSKPDQETETYDTDIESEQVSSTDEDQDDQSSVVGEENGSVIHDKSTSEKGECSSKIKEKCNSCLKRKSTGNLCQNLQCKFLRAFYCKDCFNEHHCESKFKSLAHLEEAALGIEVKKKKRVVKHQKVRGKAIVKNVLKEKRKLQRSKVKVQTLLKKHLGHENAVTSNRNANKRSYVFRCPECPEDMFVSEKLARHLQIKHKFSKQDALMEQSRRRILYLWCSAKKHERNLPLPCEICGIWFTRLDNHLKTSPNHVMMTEEEKEEEVIRTKEKFWGRKIDDAESYSESVEVQEKKQEFQRRSKNQASKKNKKTPEKSCSKSYDKSTDYLPSGSQRITDKLKKSWMLTDDDYMDNYYTAAEDLLEKFKTSLEESGHENQNAVQHKNSVELIWASVDQEMTMFPKSSLSNIHLFRDFYHRPNFKIAGTSEGVQASTLRARYVSLNFFFQFLRKNQIFAGMNRKALNLIEKAVEDFNKELNRLIKQRKVDVRADKRNNLLTAHHFIEYGRSNHCQRIINFSKAPPKMTSVQEAITMRDYLITSFVIGNGLRASNIMQLKVSDIEEASTVDGYPGHKVIENNKYKTSTIYGEKFIVISEQLWEQCIFYKNTLRQVLTGGKRSKKFFVANGSDSMTQTNVSSALTSSFKHAKVLKANEYQRVSCTRIRCGLATFACNDGGFECGYFANHFMKNKEETTALHYNLLSNRRHALNIAMKLYSSFGLDEEKTVIADKEADMIMKDITNASNNVDIGKINQWMQEKDPSLSQQEIKEISDALAIAINPVKIATKSFYKRPLMNEDERKSKKTDHSDDDSTTHNITELRHDNKQNVEEKRINISESSTSQDHTLVLTPTRKKKQLTVQIQTPPSVAKLAKPKRTKSFTTEEVKTIHRQCIKIIKGEILITKENVQKLLGKTELFQKYTFEQLRTRIQYERTKNHKHNLKTKEAKREIKQSNYEESSSDKITNDNKFKNDTESDTASEESDKQSERSGTQNEVSKIKSQSIIKNDKAPAVRVLRKRNLECQITKAKNYGKKSSDQKGFQKLRIVNPIRGFGVFASQPFCKDDYLLTYKGDLISASEGDKREASYRKANEGNFMFYFENEYRGKKKSYCVDATKTESLCKYVNDSPRSHANCKMDRVNDKDGTPYLCLFAIKDIIDGEELRYDYGDRDKKLWWRETEECIKPLTVDSINVKCIKDLENEMDEDIIPPTPKKNKPNKVQDFNIEYTKIC